MEKGFINKGMPQRDRLIERNKIAIQQMKVRQRHLRQSNTDHKRTA